MIFLIWPFLRDKWQWKEYNWKIYNYFTGLLFYKMYILINIKKKGVYIIMRGHFLTGVVAGAIITTAASIMAIPQMSYRNRWRMNKMGRRITRGAGNLMDNLRDYTK